LVIETSLHNDARSEKHQRIVNNYIDCLNMTLILDTISSHKITYIELRNVYAAKKFCPFYGTRKSTTVSAAPRHWSLWPRRTRFASYHPSLEITTSIRNLKTLTAWNVSSDMM